MDNKIQMFPHTVKKDSIAFPSLREHQSSVAEYQWIRKLNILFLTYTDVRKY